MNLSQMMIALADAIAPESDQVPYGDRYALLSSRELELLESVALARCATTDAERTTLGRWHRLVGADITNATSVIVRCTCGAVETMTFSELRATPWYRCPACHDRNVAYELVDAGNPMHARKPHGGTDHAVLG